MKTRTWRHYVRDETERMYAAGEKNLPRIADAIRDDFPLRYILDCARAAIYSAAQATIRAKQRQHQQEQRLRISDGSGSWLYQTLEQTELPGIIEWAQGQIERSQKLTSSAVEGVECWKEAHPECELSVAQIIEMAERGIQ